MHNNPAQRPEWKALAGHRAKMSSIPLRDLLTQDKDRFENFSLRHDGFLFDFSRHPVTRETLDLLTALARATGVEGWRDRMIGGDIVNVTENRPAVHMAQRAAATDTVIVDGQDIMPSIQQTLDQMREISERVRMGAWKGHNGKTIRDVVHIGIGGSYLGPRMACAALAHLSPASVKMHFVSNVDGAQIHAVLSNCQPETTLFIIASKTFTTVETMTNAATARQWLLDGNIAPSALGAHLIAISSNIDAASAFGVSSDHILPMHEGVGGRYSVWSAIGLPVCIVAGFEHFADFLNGAHSMDGHFRTAPMEKNIPVIMALLGLWQRNFQDAAALAVIPYDARLALLPGYLQQLEMESNGKSVDRHGHPVHDYDTSPVIFGAPGTDAQHSFFQWLHQGTDPVAVDLIAACTPDHPHAAHHDILLANMAAQAKAFSHGRATGEPHRVFNGNRAVSCILIDRLNGYHAGQLIAAYEHKVFVQGILWNINSFDQFGVELGKEIATTIGKGDLSSLDPATQSLLSYMKSRRAES